MLRRRRRQTKGGQLGGRRPHERRLAGPPFRGSVLNVARCCALPPVSCPETRSALRQKPRQAKHLVGALPLFLKAASREAFAGNASSFFRLRRAGPSSCAKGRAPGRSAVRSAASRRRRTVRCPAPRRNVRQSALTSAHRLEHSDAPRSGTAFPDAATRHKPPDALRSCKELSRVHPARDALTLVAPRLSPPRRRSTPDAVSLRVSGPVTPHSLAVQRCPWAPAETTL